MALGQEAAEQLWQELVGGYNLNARLMALLEQPLDICGQEAAKAMSQELSRVFMVALFRLKPDDSSPVAGARTVAPEATSISQCMRAKDKRICGEEAAPRRKSRGDDVKRKEFTASPHMEGYRWKKYGQKNIRNSKFPRLYYSCTHSHEHGCRAKKRVQQQDSSGRPMFQVTYVNEHTCYQVLPSQSTSNATISPAVSTTTMARNGTHFDPAVHVGGSAGMEMGFSCGSPFPPPVEAPAPPLPSSLPPPLAVESSSSYQVGGGNIPIVDPMTMEEMYFSCGGPLFSPVAARSSISGWDDVSMAVVDGRYTDTSSLWPHY